VAVYTSADNPIVLRESEAVDGGHVLPGFQLPLPDLFGELDLQG
jgi:hypothetical protein